MTTQTRGRLAGAVLAILAAALPAVTLAAVPVLIVKADLKPLIRAGMDSPVQFAVLVPHAVSAASGGSWSTADGRATWRYAVDVPTAVSVSFHAINSSLPASATLEVRGAKTTTSYRARDLHRGELWSRIQPGEALQFTLTVAAEDRSKVAFSIVSLQAGYRSLGPGVKDHPYYLKLKAQQAAASGTAACVANYRCEITTANTPPGAATMALTIGNLYQCSGSLINDVPGDNTPYVLTARHCEAGHLGGGNPGAASTVTVYWDAVTACGAALGSIYEPGIPIQTGAQTIVEQQDAWLIELDVNPVVSDAQLTGFDASGGAVHGGYTIHHAEGYDKQFAAWFGTAAHVQGSGVLGVTYVSNFWETVNQLGNIGPGASGSGLFDQNNHLVGSLSLGRTTTDRSGYGACPLANPPAPNGSNGVADFTALYAVWDSIADTTSSTGSTTLKSVLDPGDTGTVVVPSVPVANIAFTASAQSVTFDVSVGLSWNAVNATKCTAGGGAAGDGWSGTLSASGTQSVRETVAGIIIYTLTCTYPGGRTAKTSVLVTWVGPTPQLQFTPSPYVAWATTSVILSWTSNVAPCSITGGGVMLSNLPASGTTPVTQATAGDVFYNLVCGPENNSGSIPTLEQWITPSLTFNANGTDRLLGAGLILQWGAAPNAQCVPSGGAPNDGWASTLFRGSGQFFPQVTTLGTYTYTLTCSVSPLSLTKSVTVTFENNAPYVTASLSSPSVTFSDSPADYVTLTYNSNLATCSLLSNPNTGWQVPPDPQGVLTIAPTESGTYQLSLRCVADIFGVDDTATTPVMTLTVLPPPPPTVAMSFTPATTLVVQQPFTIAWSSTNAQSCTETGTIPGDNEWGGAQGQDQPSSGQALLFSAAAGQFTVGLTCQSIDPNTASGSTQATLNVVNLTATLTASATSMTTGSSFTLTWSSTGATGCVASGGGANGTPWSGSLATSGTVTQTATTDGTFQYLITCALGNEEALAQATVKVSAPISASSGSSGSTGSSGGGAIGVLELELLGALWAWRGAAGRQALAGRRRAA
jgi:lysyl endopeptidase